MNLGFKDTLADHGRPIYEEGSDASLDRALAIFRKAATTRCEGKSLKMLAKAAQETDPERLKSIKKALTKEVATLAQLPYPVEASEILPAISTEIAKD